MLTRETLHCTVYHLAWSRYSIYPLFSNIGSVHMSDQIVVGLSMYFLRKIRCLCPSTD